MSKKMKKSKGKLSKIVVAKGDYDDLAALESLPKDTIIHAYKATTSDGSPPYNDDGTIVYAVGYEYSERDYSTKKREDCGKGLNVATMNWVIGDFSVEIQYQGYNVFLVSFSPKDIVCVPYRTNGKLRVKRFDVVKNVTRMARRIVNK